MDSLTDEIGIAQDLNTLSSPYTISHPKKLFMPNSSGGLEKGCEHQNLHRE
jgi:hypothetical protein